MTITRDGWIDDKVSSSNAVKRTCLHSDWVQLFPPLSSSLIALLLLLRTRCNCEPAEFNSYYQHAQEVLVKSQSVLWKIKFRLKQQNWLNTAMVNTVHKISIGFPKILAKKLTTSVSMGMMQIVLKCLPKTRSNGMRICATNEENI